MVNIFEYIYIGMITLTCYHAVPSQTDSTPLLTASGLQLTEQHSREMSVIALPPRFMNEHRLKFGDTLIIASRRPDFKSTIGRRLHKVVLQDVMNKRYDGQDYGDLLVNDTVYFKLNYVELWLKNEY